MLSPSFCGLVKNLHRVTSLYKLACPWPRRLPSPYSIVKMYSARKSRYTVKIDMPIGFAALDKYRIDKTAYNVNRKIYILFYLYTRLLRNILKYIFSQAPL